MAFFFTWRSGFSEHGARRMPVGPPGPWTLAPSPLPLAHCPWSLAHGSWPMDSHLGMATEHTHVEMHAHTIILTVWTPV